MQREAVPTRLSAIVFRGKATLLQIRRAAQDVAGGIARYPTGHIADFPFVIAESRSPLWSESSEVEWLLQTGKVQNLRCALRRLHGIRIPAGRTFSFWKQTGQATRRRGYVEGRLLREGCLMPAVGGGLCQLSNALYQVALQAEIPIVERWGHSRVVPGSAAALGHDATIAWNYIDLRFRPAHDILLEAFLTSDELVVHLRAKQAPPRATTGFVPLSSIEKSRPLLNVELHSCTSCGQEQCFRHTTPPSTTQGHTAFLLDECWPEFQNFVAQNHTHHDVLLIPLDGTRWHQPRYQWDTAGFAQVHTATAPTLLRSLTTRRLGAYGAARLQAQIAISEKLATHFSRALKPSVTHLIVAQSLLPFLWRDGHLGGRTFEVLMTRLPLHILHARLDAAAHLHPDRPTLCEFRAPPWLVEAEQAALQNARIITPHHEIAALFPTRTPHLDWHFPPTRKVDKSGTSRTIAFPGPVAARKGAYEVRAAARELGLEVVVMGSELEGDEFWRGVKTRRAGEDWLEGVAAVVQPSLVEDQPRRLLQALAAGVPVVATAACGIGETEALTLIPAGDETALIDALSSFVLD